MRKFSKLLLNVRNRQKVSSEKLPLGQLPPRTIAPEPLHPEQFPPGTIAPWTIPPDNYHLGLLYCPWIITSGQLLSRAMTITN